MKDIIGKRDWYKELQETPLKDIECFGKWTQEHDIFCNYGPCPHKAPCKKKTTSVEAKLRMKKE